MISVLIVCQQVDEKLMRTIRSVEAIKPQILVDISTHEESLGARKNRLMLAASFDWVLILDTDECASPQLLREIKTLVLQNTSLVGCNIAYQNYAFGAGIKYGGESYAKTRIFKKKYGKISILPIHEEIEVDGTVGNISGVIHHYSYVSLPQVLVKFTKYAWVVAGEKVKKGERVTLKKLFLYAPHMVWARAIKDEGWRDGWRGILLAICFGYMEGLTYWFLLWRNIFHY